MGKAALSQLEYFRQFLKTAHHKQQGFTES